MINIKSVRKDLCDAMAEIAHIEQGKETSRRGLRALVSHLNFLHLYETLQEEQTPEAWPEFNKNRLWPQSEFVNQCRALQNVATTGQATSTELLLIKWLISGISGYTYKMTTMSQMSRLEARQRPEPGTVR